MLTADELSSAVAQHGVTFKKPKYYADDKAAAAVCRPAAAVASVSWPTLLANGPHGRSVCAPDLGTVAQEGARMQDKNK